MKGIAIITAAPFSFTGTTNRLLHRVTDTVSDSEFPARAVSTPWLICSTDQCHAPASYPGAETITDKCIPWPRLSKHLGYVNTTTP